MGRWTRQVGVWWHSSVRQAWGTGVRPVCVYPLGMGDAPAGGWSGPDLTFLLPEQDQCYSCAGVGQARAGRGGGASCESVEEWTALVWGLGRGLEGQCIQESALLTGPLSSWGGVGVPTGHAAPRGGRARLKVRMGRGAAWLIEATPPAGSPAARQQGGVPTREVASFPEASGRPGGCGSWKGSR